ncbi:hypothetical protein [Streptomyces sp. NBC_00859]|uniref:hypothetical protein n=1 Tax=Streptomyces sp. NBC_00859 TaxID=2903682 RepID=UPI00386AEA3E
MRRYTKASHDVVRHQVLNSDAKILLLYVQGLPDGELGRPLSAYALKLGIKGRAYQRVKQSLSACGYLHEWRWQGERGRWVTEQLLTTVVLTRDEASGVRDGAAPPPGRGAGDQPVCHRAARPQPVTEEPARPQPAREQSARVQPARDQPASVAEQGPSGRRPHEQSPSARSPAVGGPGRRRAGGSYREEQLLKKNLPHPPPEAQQPRTPESLSAERVLLSLRGTSHDLHLGVREARQLAEAAAEWLRRGVSAGELRGALTAGLPPGGIRSAVGFLRHRLAVKLPDPEARPDTGDGPRAAGLFVCRGPGDEHVFRPVGDEAHCRRCRTVGESRPQGPAVRGTPWRARVAAVNG